MIRNPYFREWSHAAQPDGFPDRIVWRLGATGEAAVTAVERGNADYTLDPPPPDRLPELRTRFASQLDVDPTDETIFMGLNTRRRPFTDPRVRQALSYAIDRGKLAQLLGQDSHPICQMLPPYIPGHQPYCPYTLNPSDAGVWHAPNLRKAQSLIAASGIRGTPITIWNQHGFSTDFTASARYLVSLLDRLGYPTRVKSFSVNDRKYLPRLDNSRTSPQAYSSTGPRISPPRRSSSARSSGAVRASFRTRPATATSASSAIRNSTQPSAAHSPPKPPTRPPSRSCGPKQTGSSLIRRRP